MHKGKSLWLSIIVTLMLATVGIAHDKGQDPDMRQLDRDRRAQTVQSRAVIFVRQIIIPLLQRASKSVDERYNLDRTTINELRQSINELVETLLEQPKTMRPLVTAARRQRDQGAVARHLTAWLDQQLSLTVDQREKIEQRLIANAGKGRLVNAGDILWNPLRLEAVVRQRFKYPPDDVLSPTQLVIWEQVVVSPKFNIRGKIPEHAKEIVARVQAEIIEDLKAGRIDRGVVELRLEFRAGDEVEAFKVELWGEGEDDDSESPEKMRRLAAAKLAAHTEQLGPLEESASERLTLATKGVVEEYLDTQGEDSRAKYEEAEKEVREAVVAGKMTRLEAAQRLEGLRRRFHAEERSTNSDTDITRHPLYQRTIEDVLPQEVFAQYKARQAERQAFRQQAWRDVLVASMDAELLLSDGQRKHFETTAEEVLALPVPDEVSAPVYMVHQLFQRADHELLSPRQREEFERIYREIEPQAKLGEKKWTR